MNRFREMTAQEEFEALAFGQSVEALMWPDEAADPLTAANLTEAIESLSHDQIARLQSLYHSAHLSPDQMRRFGSAVHEALASWSARRAVAIAGDQLLQGAA